MLERVPTLDDRYIYAADLVRVVDGDTVVLDIDLGCGMWLRGEHCRLHGIDAPEKRGEEKLQGLRSLSHLLHILDDVDQLSIRTHMDKKGKFGRWLVELWTDKGIDINQKMITDGYAVRYE